MEEEELVVKLFRSLHSDKMSLEIKNLNQVQEFIPNVPKVIGVSDDNSALFLTPVGNQFWTVYNEKLHEAKA